MNYKYLSKYHHVYRLSIGGDKKAHLEKFPIAYSNKHYIYIIVPGNTELVKAVLEPGLYRYREIYTEFNEEIAKQISVRAMERIKERCYGPFNCYFILDDISPVEEFVKTINIYELQRAYVEKEIQDLTKRKEMWEKNKKETEYEIANLTLALEKLEKNKNFDDTLPEGVTLG